MTWTPTGPEQGGYIFEAGEHADNLEIRLRFTSTGRAIEPPEMPDEADLKKRLAAVLKTCRNHEQLQAWKRRRAAIADQLPSAREAFQAAYGKAKAATVSQGVHAGVKMMMQHDDTVAHLEEALAEADAHLTNLEGLVNDDFRHAAEVVAASMAPSLMCKSDILAEIGRRCADLFDELVQCHRQHQAQPLKLDRLYALAKEGV